ncbi:MAG: hypothetical protein QM541_04345 [Flavobacterium sp.]|nr:hypothetical protein [Flavobacterium sp.]
MKKKIILGGLVTAAFGLIAIWFFIFYLPSSDFYKNYKRDQAYKTAIKVTAKDLVKEFLANEQAAYQKYTGKNKATGKDIIVEVTGEIISDKLSEGYHVITLKSDDAFSSVACTLREYNGEIMNGTITIKGLCTGFLSDVNIIEAIIVKQ